MTKSGKWHICHRGSLEVNIDIKDMLYGYNFVLYWWDAFIIIKWLKQLVCMVCTNYFIICVLIVINKQTNKQINNSLSIIEKCNMRK